MNWRNNMEGDLIKAKVRVDKQFYPKDTDIENGDFGILTVFVNEVIEHPIKCFPL